MSELLIAIYKTVKYAEEMHAIGKVDAPKLTSMVDAAIDDLTRVIADGLDPEEIAQAYNSRGYARMVKGRLNGSGKDNFLDAARDFETALENQSKCKAAFMANLGVAYYELGIYDKALAALNGANSELAGSSFSRNFRERVGSKIRLYKERIEEAKAKLNS